VLAHVDGDRRSRVQHRVNASIAEIQERVRRVLVRLELAEALPLALEALLDLQGDGFASGAGLDADNATGEIVRGFDSGLRSGHDDDRRISVGVGVGERLLALLGDGDRLGEEVAEPGQLRGEHSFPRYRLVARLGNAEALVHLVEEIYVHADELSTLVGKPVRLPIRDLGDDVPSALGLDLVDGEALSRHGRRDAQGKND
jgi:hypothetical protein